MKCTFTLTFISVQSCICFSQISCIDDRKRWLPEISYSGPLFPSYGAHTQFQGKGTATSCFQLLHQPVNEPLIWIRCLVAGKWDFRFWGPELVTTALKGMQDFQHLSTASCVTLNTVTRKQGHSRAFCLNNREVLSCSHKVENLIDTTYSREKTMSPNVPHWIQLAC